MIPSRQVPRSEAAPGPSTSRYRESPHAGGWSNSRWLEGLRGSPSTACDNAAGRLLDYLRAGLTRTFATESSITQADIEDFAQDAVIRILGRLDSFRGESRFTTWATTIALRVAYTSLRRRRHAHVSLEELNREPAEASWIPSAANPDPSRSVEREEMLDALRRAITERLTDKQRTVILSELKGIASDRVADLLGTNRNAVYKVYHDARKKLRMAMIEAGFRVEDVRDLWEVAK